MHQTEYLQVLRNELTSRGFSAKPEAYRPELLFTLQVDRAFKGTIDQKIEGTDDQKLLARLNNAAGVINVNIMGRSYKAPVALRRTDFLKDDLRIIYDLCTTFEGTPLTKLEQSTPEEIEEKIGKNLHTGFECEFISVFKKRPEFDNVPKKYDSALAGQWDVTGLLSINHEKSPHDIIDQLREYLE